MLLSDSSFYEKYRDTPINKMQIIGSHDAGASQIMCGGENKWIRIGNVARYIIPGVDEIIKDWTLTQDLGIYEQLQKGIRALDLRVTYHNGNFYFSHTFFCIRADKALREIRRYIDDVRELRFVCLFFKPDWEYRGTFDTKEFQRLLLQIFDETLFVKRSYTFPTLGQCLSNQRQIFCGFTEESSDLLPEWIWGSDFFNGIWIQTLNDNEFYNSAKAFIQNSHAHKMNHIPLVKTPTTDVIKEDVKNRFKLCFYKPQNLKVWSSFSSQVLYRLKSENVDTSSISVFWLDYV